MSIYAGKEQAQEAGEKERGLEGGRMDTKGNMTKLSQDSLTNKCTWLLGFPARAHKSLHPSESQNDSWTGGRGKKVCTGSSVPLLQACYLFSIDFPGKPPLLPLCSKMVLLSMVDYFKIKTAGKKILGLHFHGAFLISCGLGGKTGFPNIPHQTCFWTLISDYYHWNQIKGILIFLLVTYVDYSFGILCLRSRGCRSHVHATSVLTWGI